MTDNVPRLVPSIAVAVGGGSSVADYDTNGVAHVIARSAFLVSLILGRENGF